MTYKDIQAIIKEFENSKLTVLELEYKDIKLKLSKNKDNNIIIEEKNKEILPKINVPKKEIKSPLVGTFYSASNPNEQPYVNIGDEIKKGDVVCIVEAMKIMNEITSEFDGIITDIHVKNGEAVGYDQVLFTVSQNGKK